jgi:hypothetical protein
MVPRRPTSFRLSPEAREMLAAMAEKLGLTAAHTLEILVRKGHNEGVQGLVEPNDPKWDPALIRERLLREQANRPGPKPNPKRK